MTNRVNQSFPMPTERPAAVIAAAPDSRCTIPVSHPALPAPDVPRSRRSNAFTLVELLLVMALIVAAVSVAGPTLANFFRGRSLDSEARRMLSLTHAGQSRAVYEGVPMLLWVDPDRNAYGLKEEPGWVDTDPKAVEFTLDKDLHLQIVKSGATRSSSPMNSASMGGQHRVNAQNMPEIRFLPDGSIDETSPGTVRVFDRDNISRYLVMGTNRVSYEIRSEIDQ